jgi:glycosyltransferase involved in cell wall biosynthesis
VVRCYEAYFRNTPASVPLLVVDDKGWDRRPFTVLKEVFSGDTPPAHDVVVLEQISNKGFLLTMNDAFAAAGSADVVILNSDVIVGPEWLDRLREAADSANTIATVSALTNHGTIVSIPKRNIASDDVPGGLSVDEAARRVAAGSPRLRPRVPTAIGHCTYVRRAALEVVGSFDPAFSPGYGEEVDFSQRAIAAGFEHVVADDVYVYHRGGSSFGRSPAVEKRKYEHEQMIQNRYQYYGPWVRRVATDDYSPLAASLLAARRSVLGMVVAVDGMCLGPLAAGTQVIVVETVRALAARPDVRQVVVYTPLVVPDYVKQAFAGLDKIIVEPISSKLEPWHGAKAHAVFRPYQVRDAGELEWLRTVADRVVVHQLDYIAYHDAAYFGSDAEWRRYRDLARLTASTVDALTFLSRHSRDAAAAEGLLPADKPNRVIYSGTDHTALAPATASQPSGTDGLQPGFLLCLGVSYLHKNRMFALRMLKELHAGGWHGSLVLAGAHPPYGTSTPEEAKFLIANPALAEHVFNLGMFSEAEKVWLYQNAGLALYPTISEGFGLIPFEAAHLGAPCLSTRQGSLDEVLPAGIPTISRFDPVAAAATARALLDDPAAGQKVVEEILGKGAEYSWEKVAAELMTVLTEVTGRPANRVVAIRAEHGSAYLADAGVGAGSHTGVKRSLDSAVQFVAARPDLRVKLVPPGSKRQAMVRQVLAKAHIRL